MLKMDSKSQLIRDELKALESIELSL
jgi:hypothetical protein